MESDISQAPSKSQTESPGQIVTCEPHHLCPHTHPAECYRGVNDKAFAPCPTSLATHQKTKGPRLLSEPSRNVKSELGGYYGQTNPEGRARLMRRLIMDLVRIVIARFGIARVAHAFSGFLSRTTSWCLTLLLSGTGISPSR